MTEIAYQTRTVSVVVLPKGHELFSEMATTISITDEAGGEFVEVTQSREDGLKKIAIEPQEWPSIRAAIDRLIGECKAP